MEESEVITEPPEVQVPLSKRQIKRIAKLEQWEIKKKEKRLREKQKYREKKASGEWERRGPSRKELKRNKVDTAKSKISVAIDLNYDELMTDKDVAKCVKQLLRVYTVNRRSAQPVPLYFAGVKEDSRTLKNLQRNDGYQNWDVKFCPETFLNIGFEKGKIVYLTAESDNVLTTLEEDKVYVIGGLVDHNQHKGLCHEMATKEGISTARLPLSEFVEMKTRTVLTVPHESEGQYKLSMSAPDASIKDYELHEKLGAGSYATVFRATKKDSGEVCAIKCVEKSTLKCPQAEDNIITEIRLLKTLKHPHIVEMRDFLWDSKTIYIITEFCDGGDLSSYIRRRHSLPESVCKIFLRQLALALRYMRQHDVSHFDLKPQNLLLCRSPGKYILKVADFGFAQHLKLGEANTMIKGSLLYMAPEILLKRCYDARADLYSVGVILFECLFGRAPYRSATLQELLDKIQKQQRIEIPSHTKISSDCENLLRRLLRPNVDDRVTFEDFFSHDFIDLEHMPSEENFQKAAQIFTDAVTKDSEGKFREAYHLYCTGLKYFGPIVNEESDASKRQVLRSRMNSYVQRAEEIKQTLFQRMNSTESVPNIPKPPLPVTMSAAEQILEPRARFKQVYKMSASSPAICHALDIGRDAELFAREKNLEMALDKYKMALGSLVPLLQKEPKGQRRDLLYAQITDWMEEAESIKALIDAKAEEPELHDGQERCCIQ